MDKRWCKCSLKFMADRDLFSFLMSHIASCSLSNKNNDHNEKIIHMDTDQKPECRALMSKAKLSNM